MKVKQNHSVVYMEKLSMSDAFEVVSDLPSNFYQHSVITLLRVLSLLNTEILVDFIYSTIFLSLFQFSCFLILIMPWNITSLFNKYTSY